MAIKPTLSKKGLGPVQEFIGTAYDIVKKVHDNLDAIIALDIDKVVIERDKLTVIKEQVLVSEQNIAAMKLDVDTTYNTFITRANQVDLALADFEKTYLGAKAADPTVDNDGNPLTNGAFYLNTTDSVLKFYSDGIWIEPDGIALEAANSAQASANAAALSAISAQNSAANALSSETDAALSASRAQTSADTAAASELAAAASETNAANSAAASQTSAESASDSADNAAASESNALNYKNQAQSAASTAESSAINAGLSESAAAESASNAADSAASADAARVAAESAKNSAQTSAATATTKANEASVSADSAATSESNAADSASAATTSASQALASENKSKQWATELEDVEVEPGKYSSFHYAQKAEDSAFAANASEIAAELAETNAATSAANAAISESNAADSATSASQSAAAAVTAKNAAQLAESGAQAAEDNAAASASQAANSASQAASSATAAQSAETNAGVYAAAAQTARDQTLALFESFDERYLGQKDEEPTTDNNGDPLIAGALYFDTTKGKMRVFDGSQWLSAYASLEGALLTVNNLSDLDDVNIAKQNLGLDKVDNVSAASLRDRSTHTGTQTISTITGLQTALDGKAPSSHTHTMADVTGLQDELDGKSDVGHTHAISDVTGLQAALNGKVSTTGYNKTNWDTAFSWGDHSTAGYLKTVTWADVTGKPTTFTPSAHTHTIANVTGLQTALDGKSDTGHTHSFSELAAVPSTATRWPTWSEVSSKPTSFPPASHTHPVSQITGLGTAATKDVGTDDGNVMEVGAFGIGKVLNYNPDFSLEAQHIAGFGSASHGNRVPSDGPDLYIGKVLYVGPPSWGTQLWFSYYEGKAWFRNKESGKPYESWKEFIHSGNIRTSTGNSVTYPMSQKAVTDALAGKANSSHTHSWSQITGAPATATRWPTWSEVTSKPTSFTPSAHTHAWSEITGAPATATRWPAWSEVTGKPSRFTPTSSSIPSNNLNNAMAPGFYHWTTGVTNSPVDYGSMVVTAWDGTGGQTAEQFVMKNGSMWIRGKNNSSSNWSAWRQVYHTENLPTTATRWPTWGEVTGKPSTFAPSSHTHAWSQITDAPATATRWPSWSEVTSKPSTFTPSSHGHSGEDITSGTIPTARGVLGTSTTSGLMRHNGSSQTNGAFYSGTTNPNTTGQRMNYQGALYVGLLWSSNNVTAYSDARVKTDLRRIDKALDKVCAINGYTYKRTDIDCPRKAGVIAQEVLEVLPEVVTQDKEGNKHYSVEYGSMVALLIEAIKEQQKQIEALKPWYKKLYEWVKEKF